MYDADSVWTITAADGTSVTLAGPSSFPTAGTVFLVEEVTGFDSPNVRQSISDLPEADGAVAGNFFFSNRPITIKGRVIASTSSARNQAVVSLQRALRGLRSDVLIQSTPSGLPAMQINARFDNVRVTGGYVKDFIISMICPSPVIYSQTLNVQSGTGSVATSGAPFPLVFPINFGGGSGATVTVAVTNAGNFDSLPLVKVTGPIDNPWVRNATTGDALYLDNLSLAGGEYVLIDNSARTVTKSDGSNQYGKMRFPGSDWITLPVGANSVELRSGGGASTATLEVDWRDAWV